MPHIEVPHGTMLVLAISLCASSAHAGTAPYPGTVPPGATPPSTTPPGNPYPPGTTPPVTTPPATGTGSVPASTLHETDSRLWARAFAEQFPQSGVAETTLAEWFRSAILAGWDKAHAAGANPPDTTVPPVTTPPVTTPPGNSGASDDDVARWQALLPDLLSRGATSIANTLAVQLPSGATYTIADMIAGRQAFPGVSPPASFR